MARAAGGALLASGRESAGSEPSRGRPIPRAADRVPLGADEPVRIGVIGTGGMGTGHCHALVALAQQGRANCQVVALSDVCTPRLEKAHRECRERQGPDVAIDTYGNYDDILSRDDIHGVLIASPEHWHHQMAIDAIAAGKDVYLEKPMTLRLHEALHLRETVLANPETIFQVGTQMMILPKWQEAKRLIAEDAIGKPVFSQTSYCRNSKDGEWTYYHIDPAVQPGETLDWERWCGPAGMREWDPAIYARWRRYRDFSTGIVGDLLVHVMTPLMMALDAGWPTRVVASGGHYIAKDMENHDQVNLNAEFEEGHTMIVAGSTCNSTGLETLIRGYRANMYLNSRNVVMRPERIWADEIEPRTVECGNIGNDQDALRTDWVECIRSRTPAVSGVDLATKMMVVVDLATRSMWNGHAYAFDASSMSARRI